MSRDSEEGEEPKSQRTKDELRRLRPQGEPSWYDKAASYQESQEEVIQIPNDKVAHVIGRKGWRKKDIMERSGVQELFIKEDLVRLRGTKEQRANAKRIINMVLSGEDSPSQGSWKKLDFIPEKYMGQVIGKYRRSLDKIENITGATLKVFERNVYIKGSIESQKRAIREIKDIVNLETKRPNHSVRFVHVDTTQLELDHEFELCIAQPTNACNSDETKNYQLKPLDNLSQDVEETSSGFTDIDRLKDNLLMVLREIHKEKEEEEEGEMVKVIIWCHLGHSYITKVNEVEEEEDYFTLEEIKENLENKKSWNPSFKAGLEDMEVERIEKYLKSRAVKEDIRHDFSFYTPSYRDVRVKAWLTEKDAGQEGDETTSMAFSRNAPVRVRNILTHALSDEQGGDSSNTPCFYMCSQYQQRMKLDILMVSKEFDYRLLIRTCRNYVPKTPQDGEENKLLESYLRGMKIEEGQLTLPPVSERPDGFDLFYKRRSLRRTYQYEMEGEQFTLTVCKDQAETVDPVETDASSFDETATKSTDIHLHCKEWDRVLEEGNWEPEQIVDKLPTFLQFLRQVQRYVAP